MLTEIYSHEDQEWLLGHPEEVRRFIKSAKTSEQADVDRYNNRSNTGTDYTNQPEERTEQHKMPDGSPIFGEDSPHDIGKHLDAVCAEQPVGLSPDATHAVLKHLKYRQCNDEYYLSCEALAALKGELLALDHAYPVLTHEHHQ